jgi:hypothetical protein
MAVYTHRKLRIAYTWFGSRVPTPRWFDESRGLAWPYLRSWGWIQMRYWGRAR